MSGWIRLITVDLSKNEAVESCGFCELPKKIVSQCNESYLFF